MSWVCEFVSACTNQSDWYHMQASPWWKPSRRDFLVAGLGSIIGGGAMFVYDTCELLVLGQ